MTIEAAPGQGSRFTLVVPVRLKAPAGMQESTPAAEGPGKAESASHMESAAAGKISVLLADDHPVLRHGLTKVLEEQPDIHVVGEVGDGRAAVELARRLKPDVVLMDVSLPLMDGCEATRRIVSEWPGTKVIGLSMHEEPEMAATMFQAGATAYLTKGGPIEHLISIIRSCRLETYFAGKAHN